KFLKTIGASHSILNSMAAKGILCIYELNTTRIGEIEDTQDEVRSLTLEQQKALKIIQSDFQENKPVLIHGITSSGKTEVYIHLIEEALHEDKMVLFLLPEISLTSQMVQRIRKHFGETVGVYHSRFNQNERVELWEETLKGEYKIVLGARSALFLPFRDLGLIIVDEEHENAYKQTDSKPYFHARDMALVLGNLFKSNVLLGSATPSL